MFKERKDLRYPILSVGLILLLTGCSTPAISQALGSSSLPIKVVEAKAQNTSGDVTLTGVLDTDSKSIITSQIPGKAIDVQIKEGTKVKKGDVLVALDESELQTSLAKADLGVQQAQVAVDQAKLAYDSAQKNFERMEELYKAGASPLKDFEQVTTLRDNAKIAYESALNVSLPLARQNVNTAQQALTKAKIISPMDGVVASISVSAGDNVSPGVVLATLVSNEQLVLTGNVSESVVNSLQIGQEASVAIDSAKGVALKGKISFVSPVSIPTGQFFPVKVALEQSNSDLKPGMTGTALINVEAQNSIAVPNSAVIRRDGRNFVYIAKEGKAVKNPVQVGLQGEKLTAIQTGIRQGELVIVDGSNNVYEGMPITELQKVE